MSIESMREVCSRRLGDHVEHDVETCLVLNVVNLVVVCALRRESLLEGKLRSGVSRNPGEDLNLNIFKRVHIDVVVFKLLVRFMISVDDLVHTQLLHVSEGHVGVSVHIDEQELGTADWAARTQAVLRQVLSTVRAPDSTEPGLVLFVTDNMISFLVPLAQLLALDVKLVDQLVTLVGS